MRELMRRHPRIRWTHLFDPVVFTRETANSEELVALVTDARERYQAETGLHLHMYRSFLAHCEVPFRDSPTVDGVDPWSDPDPTGYAVPMTAYMESEMRRMLDGAAALFQEHGLGRPQTFCPGYYASNNALQKALAETGFTVSASAFPVGSDLGNGYPAAWRALSGWDASIDAMTVPYRISTTTLLPGGRPPFHPALDGPLLEIPQTGKIDWMMDRQAMIRLVDRHLERARSGQPSVVAFAIHVNSAARYWDRFDLLFDGIRERARSSGVEVRFLTASRFRRDWLNLMRPTEP